MLKTTSDLMAPTYWHILLLVAYGMVIQARWIPAPNSSMQYQLGQTFNINKHIIPGVDAYVIDGDTPATTVQAMLGKGLKPVCYISAGSAENYRSDYQQFPASALGNKLGGWPDERWVDIRSPAVRDIMVKRMQACSTKGFVAIDPDNVDGYTNKPGFNFTAADQLDYNRFLADTAHSLNLSVSLKNDLDQLAELVNYFDFAVNEQCHQYQECDVYNDTFVKAGKFVLEIEYSNNLSFQQFKTKVCSPAAAANISAIYKTMALKFYRRSCPGRA